METDRRSFFDSAKRMVVKVGSGVLTAPNGLNVKVIRSLSRQISHIIGRGTEVILVSSGAMASGAKKWVWRLVRMKFQNGRLWQPLARPD
jgi:glutamate 5-kinase